MNDFSPSQNLTFEIPPFFCCSQNVDEDVVAKASLQIDTRSGSAAAVGRHDTRNAVPEAYEPMEDASESDSDGELAQPVLARNARTGYVHRLSHPAR